MEDMKFDQKKTQIAQLVDFAVEMFSCENRSNDPARLLVVLSDGRGVFSEGMDKVNSAVRRARLADIFLIFVIIDNPLNRVRLSNNFQQLRFQFLITMQKKMNNRLFFIISGFNIGYSNANVRGRTTSWNKIVYGCLPVSILHDTSRYKCVAVSTQRRIETMVRDCRENRYIDIC